MKPEEILKHTREHMEKAIAACKREYVKMRTGRASASLVEDVVVSYYGTATPLKQLAGISTPQPRLLVIQPWDPSSITEIEKAILSANLGLTPNNDGKVLRLQIPQLTQERREDLAKIVKKVAEESRVSIRGSRRDANDQIKELEKKKEIPEDESRRLHEEVQKLTDSYIEKIDTLTEEKEKGIKEI